jgi:hypothetical protein
MIEHGGTVSLKAKSFSKLRELTIRFKEEGPNGRRF